LQARLHSPARPCLRMLGRLNSHLILTWCASAQRGRRYRRTSGPQSWRSCGPRRTPDVAMIATTPPIWRQCSPTVPRRWSGLPPAFCSTPAGMSSSLGSHCPRPDRQHCRPLPRLVLLDQIEDQFGQWPHDVARRDRILELEGDRGIVCCVGDTDGRRATSPSRGSGYRSVPATDSYRTLRDGLISYSTAGV
jgi:hypothetical protein